MGPRKCGVCDEAQSKYKCPNCVIHYCSLACFKKHKEIPCEKLISSSEGKLASSSEIREALRSEEIQKLICSIDSSKDAESELEKAMQKEEFHMLCQKILSAINP
ncbi:unnamed protein product [Cuscuta europaea]|uniref:HIT-type domain-containing protein n=1 Tax=Cuscuta europaea TaxID=41803 RepID=A0A9P0YRC8_CUSEU|nr:unnamed protein product [Cuscuta europaea]